MVGSIRRPSGSRLGGVHGEQTMGLKWLSSSEMLSLLSGLMERSDLAGGRARGVSDDDETTARQVSLRSGAVMGAETERLFSEERRIPAVKL